MKYQVKRTVDLIWEVEANNEAEAIRIADDMGDSKANTKGHNPKVKVLKQEVSK